MLPGLDTAAVRLGTVEEADFGACTECLLDGFYKDMLTLASDEFSAEEMEKLRPALNVLRAVFMTPGGGVGSRLDNVIQLSLN